MYFFCDFFSFLLKRHITWQAARQVFALLRCSQSTEKCFQIVFHISLYHLTTLDHREHECIMLCRYFTSYIAGILQVHLYPTHHLLAHVVRQFEVAAFQHPPHRLPLSLRVFQFLLEQHLRISIRHIRFSIVVLIEFPSLLHGDPIILFEFVVIVKHIVIEAV